MEGRILKANFQQQKILAIGDIPGPLCRTGYPIPQFPHHTHPSIALGPRTSCHLCASKTTNWRC